MEYIKSVSHTKDFYSYRLDMRQFTDTIKIFNRTTIDSG